MDSGAVLGRVDVDASARELCATSARYSSRRFYILRYLILSGALLAVVMTVAAFDARRSPAMAQTCSPVANGGSFTAAQASTTCTGTFNTNINFGGPPSPPPSLSTLTLQQGPPSVIVNSPGGNAVNIQNTFNATDGSGASATINANDATISNINNPGGTSQSALRIVASGNATVTASGIINITGGQSTNAIFSTVLTTVGGMVASVAYSGAAAPGVADINLVGGPNSTAIQACANAGCGYSGTSADGNAVINATGNLNVVGGSSSFGLDAVAGGNGIARVDYNGGVINLMGGSFSNGIFASGGGSATITTVAGTTIIVSSTGAAPTGVAAFTDTGTATATVASTILIDGNPAVPTTNYKFNPTGIEAQSDVGGDAIVTYSGPGIAVHGGGGLGIIALSGSADATTASGNVTVNASGSIVADGSNAVGILADSGFIRNVFSSGGRVPTTITGSVDVTASNVSALGQFGTAISATGGAGGVMVNIAQGGTIMGGWQADVASVGSVYGLPAAGVVLGSVGGGTATLINNGSIGALSDRAVASPLPSFFANPTSTFPTSNNTSIINEGTITGFVQLVGSNNSIVNDGTFNLRHFADTDGNGIRDTLRVAVSDLGPGTFTNNGTLALLSGPGATTLDSTGQYLPLGLAFNAMALGGPVQGQILGATTFTNSGTIDLQANPVPGDVLVISGGHTPGTTGGGTFIANGGRLLLDTVLNEGGANSRSDVLVVDGTAVGLGGATRLFAQNAGGAGALTVDNGILVVQSVDPARSVAGVFTLGAPAVAGPFEYTLFHGGVGADAANGNWYLRSTINCTLAPNLPECAVIPPSPIAPPSPTVPNFRVETSLYAAIPSMALLYGRNLLDTLHERVGEEFDEGGARAALASGYNKAPPGYAASPYLGWGRVIGMNGVQRGDSLGVLSSGTGGPRFDYTFLGLQAGMDFFRQDWSDGSRDHAGAYFAIGGDHGRVTHFDGTRGDSDFNAYSLGGYWTHFGATGWYTDTILQGTFYDFDSTANRGLPALKTAGQGIAASLEGGYPFKFAGGWFIEPQAQLIYQNINVNNASDIAAQIRFADVDSLLGRIGARFGRTWAIDDSSPRTITAWIRPNLWNEFRGNPTTSFSSETGFIPFFADLGGLWGEINVGVSGQFNTNTTFYVNASYQSRFDGGGFAYTGKAGLRVNW